jgi:hypothetical protein
MSVLFLSSEVEVAPTLNPKMNLVAVSAKITSMVGEHAFVWFLLSNVKPRSAKRAADRAAALDARLRISLKVMLVQPIRKNNTTKATRKL